MHNCYVGLVGQTVLEIKVVGEKINFGGKLSGFGHNIIRSLALVNSNEYCSGM